MSRPRDKGTFAETAVTDYLGSSGFPYAERIALGGSKDKGDVKVCPGIISEVKNCATIKLPQWFREVTAEKENAGAKHAFLVVKPAGIGRTRVGQWWAGMLLGDLAELMVEAGGPPVVDEPVWLPGHRYLDVLPERIKDLSGLSEFGYVGIRPAGVEDLRYWYAMTQLEQIVRLLRKAGYGNPEGLS